MSTTKKSKSNSLQQLLNAMGLSEQEIRKEVSDEVLMTKMSLVGTLEGIKFVCESLKNMVLTTPGRLNVQLIRLYLTAIQSSSMFAMGILDKYEGESHGAALPLTNKKKKNIQPVYELSEDDLDEIENSLDATEQDLEALDSQLREEASSTLTPEELAQLEELEKAEASESSEEDDSDDLDDLLDLKGFVPVKGKVTDPKKQN